MKGVCTVAVAAPNRDKQQPMILYRVHASLTLTAKTSRKGLRVGRAAGACATYR